jgi:hypothetical protein
MQLRLKNKQDKFFFGKDEQDKFNVFKVKQN